MVGRTSMEVGVRVEAGNYITGELRHTASAYLSFVALNKKGKPKKIPALKLESAEEKRRNQEAAARKSVRLELRRKENKCQKHGICTV